MLDSRDYYVKIKHKTKTRNFLSIFWYHYILGIADKDKYKDTVTSFVHSMTVCSGDDRPAIKNNFIEAFLQSDEKFEKETKELVSEMEKRINDVLNVDMPDCLKEFTDILADKYYYTFKLLWLSKISGIKSCDSDCLIDNTDQSHFIFRAMRDIIVLGVDEDLSCSEPNDYTCNFALQTILGEKFTSSAYLVQKGNMKTAIDGMIGNLSNSYLDWVQRPGMAECRNEMIKICLGNPLKVHRITSII